MCVCVCVCVCVLCIMVWRSLAETSHSSHIFIPLLKEDSNHSLSVSVNFSSIFFSSTKTCLWRKSKIVSNWRLIACNSLWTFCSWLIHFLQISNTYLSITYKQHRWFTNRHQQMPWNTERKQRERPLSSLTKFRRKEIYGPLVRRHQVGGKRVRSVDFCAGESFCFSYQHT